MELIEAVATRLFSGDLTAAEFVILALGGVLGFAKWPLLTRLAWPAAKWSGRKSLAGVRACLPKGDPVLRAVKAALADRDATFTRCVKGDGLIAAGGMVFSVRADYGSGVVSSVVKAETASERDVLPDLTAAEVEKLIGWCQGAADRVIAGEKAEADAARKRRREVSAFHFEKNLKG